MKRIDGKIHVAELKKMSEAMYGNFVKAVVDLERDILVVDAEMHADAEQILLEDGSKQNNLWGVNLYPDKFDTEDFVEFDSMINIRPRQQNMSRGVEDEATRLKIKQLIKQKVVS